MMKTKEQMMKDEINELKKRLEVLEKKFKEKKVLENFKREERMKK